MFVLWFYYLGSRRGFEDSSFGLGRSKCGLVNFEILVGDDFFFRVGRGVCSKAFFCGVVGGSIWSC